MISPFRWVQNLFHELGEYEMLKELEETRRQRWIKKREAWLASGVGERRTGPEDRRKSRQRKE
jgi:hypothetical protein